MRSNSTKPRRRNVLVLILVFVLILFVHDIIGASSVVEGVSMFPTFKPNDVVRAKTLLASPKRGDVVIFIDDRGDRVIKRIIGLPGETVTIYRGFVYLNHRRLMEPYLPALTYTFKSETENELPAEWRLGDDEFFMLGDNRLRSHDSRAFGPVERHNIHSIVSLPANELGPEFCEIELSETEIVLRFLRRSLNMGFCAKPI
jgi:signal peptidase I